MQDYRGDPRRIVFAIAREVGVNESDAPGFLNRLPQTSGLSAASGGLAILCPPPSMLTSLGTFLRLRCWCAWVVIRQEANSPGNDLNVFSTVIGSGLDMSI